MIDMRNLDWSSWLRPYGSRAEKTGSTGATGKASPTAGGWEWDDPGNTAAPSWMGSGAYAKWWQGSDPDYDPNDPAVKQRWWRSPSVGGGIVWHPYWGWQDRAAIKDLYKADQDNAVTWDEFTNWGLTQQLGEDWKTYFPDAVTDAESGLTGGTSSGTWGGSAGLNTVDSEIGDVTYDYSGLTPTYSGEAAYVENPPEWDIASNLASYMAMNGMPTSTDDWYTAAKAKTAKDIEAAIKQSNEQAGLGGMRWSTPLAYTNAKTAADAMTDLGAEYASQTMQSLENARARQLQASGLLSTLGQQYADYPLAVSSQAFEQGQAMTAQQQAAIDKIYQEFMRNTEENNPWLNLAYQLATGQGIQQQYTPGAGTQGLGVLSALLGNILGGL